MVFTRLLKTWKGRLSASRAVDAAMAARLSAREGATTSSLEHTGLSKALGNLVRQSHGPHPLVEATRDLEVELAAVTRILKDEFSSRLENPFRALALESGVFEGVASQETTQRSRLGSTGNGPSPFLYMRLPGLPGFLFTPEGDETLVVCRASAALPLLRNADTGGNERPAVFARRSGPFATLICLEPGLWRYEPTEGATDVRFAQTLSTERLAELLLTQAVQAMGNASNFSTT